MVLYFNKPSRNVISMKRPSGKGFIFVMSLLITLPVSLFSQSSASRWAVQGGAALQRFSGPFTSEQMVNASFPVARLGMSRYLRPGFDFRTDLFFAPQAPYPFVGGPAQSPFFAFQYSLAIKLNNAIFLREDSRFAPYLMLGAGGSYQDQQPDAFAPLGVGVQWRTGTKGAIRLEAARHLSFNGSPQPVSVSLMYTWAPAQERIPAPDSLAPELQIVEPIIAATEEEALETEKPVLSPLTAPALFPEHLQDLGSEPEEMLSTATLLEADDAEVDEQELLDDAEEIADIWLEEEEAETGFDLMDESKEAELFATDLVSEGEIEEDAPFPDPALPLEGENEPFASFSGPEIVENTVVPIDNSAMSASECGGLSLPAIRFEASSTHLGEIDKLALREVAEAMKTCPELILVLEGYANESRNADDNLVMSIQRAFHVKYYLVYEHQISQRRIISSGEGRAKEGQPSREVILSWQYIPVPKMQPVN